MRDWEDWLLIGCIAIGCLTLLALLVGLVADLGADKFSLRKDEWKCTEERQETYIINTIIGSGIYPIPHTQSVCVQWSRVK